MNKPVRDSTNFKRIAAIRLKRSQDSGLSLVSMKQIVTRLYPFCVFAVVLVVADTHWPETVDALSVAQHRQALGAQILDLVSTIMQPIDFTR